MSRFLRVLDENIRILPVLILATGFLVFLKSADLWASFQDELVGISIARAEESALGSSKVHSEMGGEHHDAETPWLSGGQDTYYDNTGIGLSLAEVQVLESLSERRQTLDQRENDLVLRERLILAAELRVEERIDELRVLEARI